MTDKVISTNLISASWQNVYDLIKANVVDPTISGSNFRKWVYSREPDVKDINFQDFPYIIVHPSVVDFGDVVTVNGQKRDANFSVEVEIVTCDRGYNNNDGKGLSQNNAVSDSVMSVFNNNTHRNTLRNNGLFFSIPNVTGVSLDEFKNTLVYRRTFLLSFKSLKKVFA